MMDVMKEMTYKFRAGYISMIRSIARNLLYNYYPYIVFY